jgi:DNA polymerase-4
MPERLIAHVDMDAFFAAVESRDHPEYRGRPLVVGAGPHARGVVAAASYEARRYGIHSAMPSRRAYALCPGAIFVPPDMQRYREESARVFEILDTFTPAVEPLSIDEAFLDLTGCPRPAGPDGAEPGLAFGLAIRRRVREWLDLPASVGVAPNKFLAKVASELAKPDGVRRITSGTVHAVLDPLPVAALWGVGPETRARLEGRGITTIGALRRTAPSTLRALLGFSAERLAALARGEDDRPVDSGGEAKSIGRETTFDRDTRDAALLARTLRALSDDVARRLRADGAAGRVVILKVRFEPFDTVTRRTTLAAPTDHSGRIARTVERLWRRLEAGGDAPSRRVRLLGVSVAGLEHAAGAQVALFAGAGEAGRREAAVGDPIDRVVDAINERFGEGTVQSARAAEPPPTARQARRRRAPRS